MKTNPRRTIPRAVFQGIAVGVIGAVLIGVAVVAAGFDVKQTPVNDASIWALQSGDGNRYARVNTQLGELDTIKSVRNPSALAQNSEHTLLFAQNNEQLVDVDVARPLDFGSETVEYARTPPGTVQMVSSNDTVAYRTNSGKVFVASMSDGAAATPVPVDPYAADEVVEGEERRFYRSDAIALSDSGTLVSYSAADQTVMRYNIADATITGFDPVMNGPREPNPQITLVGDTWALGSSLGTQLWLRGQNAPVEIAVSDTYLLQSSGPELPTLYLADERSLVAVTLSDGAVQRVVGGESDAAGPILGAPAQPTVFQGDVFAAWLPTATSEGTLWSTSTDNGVAPGTRRLDFGGAQLNVDAQPVFQSNGALLVLNDTQSGWVWNLPDGALIASSQDWGVLSAEQEQTNTEEEQTAEVLDPKPPVAEPDSFGVRAGQLVALPVLLNDHDPNDDVLTIRPESVSGLPAEFGTVSVTDQSQGLAVNVAAGAQGSATFSYAVTDGTRSDGLNSEATTVTLTVRDELSNEAPVWCGTERCLAEWPSPELAPGGTVTIPVLPGWVDPDGDPLFVASVVNQSGVGSVGITQSGEVAYRHPNPTLTEQTTISIAVGISDTRGAVTEKVLTLLVTPSPQLTAEPFALVTAANESLRVDPSSRISGLSGGYRIVSATAPPAAQGLAVTVNSGASTFDFSAEAPGEYVVNFTIADNLSEVQSFVRISVVAPDQATLSTPPITVFVRPKSDATVDVFTAVSNPTAGVLLVSDALPRPAPGAALEVSVVGQKLLRMRGTTADEQPGILGVVGYTVSDGTGDPRLTTQGEATVYLLPAPVPQQPIAVPDRIVVRAETQIDIPVLSNDIAPDGNRMVLNPDTIVNSSGEGLAFASGSVLRYLAPKTAGEYELRYSISIAGAPELSDTTSVAVTVLADDQNQKPLPRMLTGRVLSGETVRVPFDSFGIDPDGDEVSLDRVMTQPASGTASLSANGNAIIYSSVKGFRGPVQFDYRVRDANGDTGVASVRIGVLDEQSDPSPVTFSDYVQVQLGDSNVIVVRPAANDVDPTGGKLKLTGVSPDAVPDTAEFAGLAEHIQSVENNEVLLKAGAEPGTFAFTYTVENNRGDVGVGLIVMKVVRASIADYPVVSDTVVTLDERQQFGAGIDVVTDKVSWKSGDVSGLKLSIWGEPRGVTADGWTLRGEAPDAGLLLPFALTGVNFAGAEVVSYGFLRIPAAKDVILSLKPGLAPQKVKEAESVAFDMAPLVAIPTGKTLEIGRSDVVASGQRAGGVCRADSATRIVYEAGEGQPWLDSCVVPVRLAGAEDYTHLVVPIEITPKDPQPELRPASITASPAAPAITYDLKQMVQWQGKADPASLQFVIEQAADQFAITQDGSILTVAALDAAVPGRENIVTVRLSSHPDTPSAVLSLRVGPAPSTLPKGGTTARECSQAAGTSCVIDVIGAPGEVNVFASTPLVLVGVTAAATCTGVSFAVENARQVRASWSAETPGGICPASFVVKDAQGKRSAAERNGQVTVDLQGFPRTPNSITQTAYGDGTITLGISPGEASSAYPPLQGFRILRNGAEVAQCSANGECPTLGGLENGAKQVYEARAFNSVGNSAGAVGVTAWAYNVPGMGAPTATTEYGAETTAAQGLVALTIPNTDPSARAFLVDGVEYPASQSGNTRLSLTIGVGPHTITVQPLSRFERPSGVGPLDQQATATVTVAGLPAVNAAGALTAAETSITAPAATVDMNYSQRAQELLYIAVPSPGAPTCSVGENGGGLNFSQGDGARSSRDGPQIGNLNTYVLYSVFVCASNGFGVVQQALGEALTWKAPLAPGDGGYTYTLGERGDGFYTVDSVNRAGANVPPGFEPVVTGNPSNVFGANPGITVKFCFSADLSRCSPESAVTPAVAAQAWQVQYERSVLSCKAGAVLSATAVGQGMSTASVAVGDYEYFAPASPPTDPVDPENPGDSEPPVQPPSVGEGTWASAAAGAAVPLVATMVRKVQAQLVWPASGPTSGFRPFAPTFADTTTCTQ